MVEPIPDGCRRLTTQRIPSAGCSLADPDVEIPLVRVPASYDGSRPRHLSHLGCQFRTWMPRTHQHCGVRVLGLRRTESWILKGQSSCLSGCRA